MPSKTARRSSPIAAKALTPAQLVEAAARSEVPRITPLASGRFCYLRNPLTGKTMRLATGSPELDEVLVELGTLGLAERLTSELEGLAAAYPDTGWAEVAERLQVALQSRSEASEEG